ncbi:hypothetical protein BLA29_011396, partial [Euroglyphus maynei]
VATVESSLLIKSRGNIDRNDVDFSEQAILDCLDQNTCEDGGLPWLAWSEMSEYGIVDEKYRRYRKRWTGKCGDFPLTKYSIKVVDWCNRYHNNDEIIQTLLLKHGPLDAGISVKSNPEWKYLKDSFIGYCDKEVNHAVVLVGWTRKYWIIKNSWGAEWGIKGYLYLPRHRNKCGILNEVAMPITEYYER